MTSNTPSVIKMDRRFFSYKREMKQLFADSTSQIGGAVGRENDREERKQNLTD